MSVCLTASGAAAAGTANTHEFADVPSSYWGYEEIGQAAAMGLMLGDDTGLFRPEEPVTRAQFVTALWRLAGEPEVTGENSFTDVANGSWYEKQVTWAVQAGCVNGVSATSFNPEGYITREEAMTILFRYNGGQSGIESLLTGVYRDCFTDSAALHDWGEAAAWWSVYNCIFTGKTESTLDPGGNATRAQTAVIFLRYAENFN